ncbi:MAG: hypothetical protein E6R00_04135 [Gammaproteobacteria bacterium]|nr:MAG: hypothetical protein E6R00_04135 [Gammaproteobacteria bacterium]
MADTIITSPGGQRIAAVSPDVVFSVFPNGPSSERSVLAAAIVRHQIDTDVAAIPLPDFLTSNRALSRSVCAVLSYLNLTGQDVNEMAMLLKRMGYARKFFALAEPKNNDGLKAYLLSHEIPWMMIVDSHEGSVWDGVEFVNGFLVGLGASAASILFMLKELLEFSVDALRSPQTASRKIQDFLQGLRQLSADTVWEMGVSEWRRLNQELSENLLDLDFFLAGVNLGKLAGDLWQLFTGLAMLRKLPGMTLRLLRRAPLLMRRGAESASELLTLLRTILQGLGKDAIARLPAIGAVALKNVVDDVAEILRALQNGELLVLPGEADLMLLAPAGVAEEEGAYILLRVVDGETKPLAKIRVPREEGAKKLKQTLARVSRGAKRKKVSTQFLLEVSKAEELGEVFLKEWKTTLEKVLQEHKIPLYPNEIGTWLHTHLEVDFERMAYAFRKTMDSAVEIPLKDLAKQVQLPEELLKRLDTNLVDFVLSRPSLMKSMGVRDRKGVIAFLKRHYPNPEASILGNLQSDGILFNTDLARLISIDWTSGWGRINFIRAYSEMLAAGKTLNNEKLLALAKEFLSHSLREYGLREAALEFIFEGWETKVIEIPYWPFRS